MNFKTPAFWTKKNLISFTLLPLSLVYFIAIKLVNHFCKTYKISKPVICVGNLIAGGSGKTPTAIALGKIFWEIFDEVNKKSKFDPLQFAYLSRGYMGDGAEFLRLRGGNDKAMNVGDEAMLLSETAPTFVAKNRLFGAQQIDNIKNIKAIILDDGMQNNSLHKDLTVLVVDGMIGFGNEFLIPAGPMREPLKSGINRADLIVLIGEPKAGLMQKISHKKIIRAEILPTNLQKFSGQKLMAFSGLAYPQKFFSFLKKSNLELINQKSFPDHYNYQNSDLEELCKAAEEQGLKLITTKKDWIKFSPSFQNKVDYLDIELKFLDENFVKNELRKFVGL